MTITLIQEGERWIIQSAYADKDVVKAAGCRWNPERKTWWTDKAEVALKLASPDVVAQINAERARAHERAQASIEASRAASADITVPAPKGLSYLGYQLAGVAYAQERSATLIADEMGLGKTIQALGLINADRTIGNVLVICPASLKLNWAREARKWLVRPLRISIANGTFNPGGFVICNYEQVKKYRAQIDNVQWDLLVVDESHYLKNPKADRTRIVLGHWDRDPKKAIRAIQARRRIFMTGTPILNRPNELWTLLHSLDPKGLGANWKRFHERYCDAHAGRFGWDVSGASNLDELQAKLRASVMVRRLKVDVLTELPPKRRQVIAFAAETPDQRAAIEREKAIVEKTEAELARLRQLRDEAELRRWEDPEAYRQAVQALFVAEGVAFTETAKVRHESALAKLPSVIDHVVDCLDSEEKLVVWAHHHDVVDALAEAFAKFGVLKADGRDSVKSRDASVQAFQSDASRRVIVCGISAMGVGHTLTAAAHAVFAELDWVPGNLAQAEDRCHRIGQRDSVLVQHLMLDESLDCRMAQIIVDKMDVIDAAMNAKDADSALQAPAPLVAPTPAPQKPAGGNGAGEPDDLTPDQIAAVHEALRFLAGLDHDRAQEINGMGFNKLDGLFGHKLANLSRGLTQKEARAAGRMVWKYKRQLGVELCARIKGN